MKKILFTLLLAGVFFCTKAESARASIEKSGAATTEQQSFMDAATLIASPSASLVVSDIKLTGTADLFDCTVKGTVEVTDELGHTRTYEIDVTVKGVSCAELLKAVLSK